MKDGYGDNRCARNRKLIRGSLFTCNAGYSCIDLKATVDSKNDFLYETNKMELAPTNLKCELLIRPIN